MSDTLSAMTPDFNTRLALLEDRTKPKPRTVFDRVKDWSSILTFVVALLYTYPLGVWDRFVVTAKEQRAKELNDLRSVILSVTAADADAVRAAAGTSDPSIQQQMIQVANGRKAALLVPGLSLIEKRYEELTGAELLLLGFYVNQIGDQGDLASKMLAKSAEKMIVAKNTLLAADVMRIKAQIYSPYGSLGPDIPKSRELLKEAIGLLITADPLKSLQYAGAVALDWTNLEAVSGNWACAELLANWVIAQTQYSNPAFAQQLQTQISQMAVGRKNYKAPWIPATQETSCPAAIIPWTVSGWPWTSAK
jgi:hypothetical protein